MGAREKGRRGEWETVKWKVWGLSGGGPRWSDKAGVAGLLQGRCQPGGAGAKRWNEGG